MDAVSEYKNAVLDYKNASHTIDRAQSALSQFLVALKNNRDIAGFVGTGVIGPLEFESNGVARVDATLCLPKAIQQALVDRFEAKRRLQALWPSLPAEYRGGVDPPETVLQS